MLLYRLFDGTIANLDHLVTAAWSTDNFGRRKLYVRFAAPTEHSWGGGPGLPIEPDATRPIKYALDGADADRLWAELERRAAAAPPAEPSELEDAAWRLVRHVQSYYPTFAPKFASVPIADFEAVSKALQRRAADQGGTES